MHSGFTSMKNLPKTVSGVANYYTCKVHIQKCYSIIVRYFAASTNVTLWLIIDIDTISYLNNIHTY